MTGVQYAFTGGARRDLSFYTLTSGAGDASEDPQDWKLEGSNDGGTTWTLVDQRAGETFKWRSQTRAFKAQRPGSYSSYRLTFGAAKTLAEVELLNHDAPAALGAEVGSAATWAGLTVPVEVEVFNTGGSPLSGNVALSAPSGWTVTPASRAFGPVAPGRAQTVAFDVKVPAGTAPGEYRVESTATSGSETAKGSASVHVLGDTIEFAPNTSAEEPWMFEDVGVAVRRARALHRQRALLHLSLRPAVGRDGREAEPRHRQPVPRQGVGRRPELDARCWRRRGEIRDLSNRAWRELDLNTLRGQSRTLYLRVADSHPADGWGGWLARTRLALQRGG